MTVRDLSRPSRRRSSEFVQRRYCTNLPPGLYIGRTVYTLFHKKRNHFIFYYNYRIFGQILIFPPLETAMNTQ